MPPELTSSPLAGAALSLLIGLLLGLERERSRAPDEPLFAGIRTFPLLTLGGDLAVRATTAGFPNVLPAFLLAVAGLAVAAYLRTGGPHVGATTEVTAILSPLLGAMVAAGQPLLAAALAVVVTLLLTLKAPLHRVAGAVTEPEILAILKFAIVAVILLPLLPAAPFGPYGAIVPRHVGLVVVTVSAVSLLGYLLVRVLGSRAGWPLAGALGGLVSSTAVTLSFSGKARAVPELAPGLAIAIVLASTVLYARVIVFILLFDPVLGLHLLPRMALLFTVGAAFAGWQLLRRRPAGHSGEVALGNPADLGRAALLGLLFAGILLGSRAAQDAFGARGLWMAGFAGGMVDVDSVVLSAARLRQQGMASVDDAAAAVLLATTSNLLVKGGFVLVVGGRALARRVLPAFAVLLAATVLVLALW
jgi:uncharacterized membrane protein (DUF4010 family)